MENVLVTGAGGFIGRRLCRALEGAYRVVRVVSLRQQGAPGRDVFSCDLTQPGAGRELCAALPVRRFTAVLHLAAVLCRPGDWRNMEYFHRNNAITENVIELARGLHCGALVNFSSLAVYPVRDGTYDEDSVVDMADNTEGLYGLAKFNAEMLFRFHLRDEMPVVNLRLTQVYGPGMQEDRLLGMFVRELRERGVITVYGGGERVSNFIHVDDVAEAALAVVRRPVPGTFNLGSRRNVSYREMAERILRAAGRPDAAVELVEKGVRAKAAVNSARFEAAYGFAATREDVACLLEDSDG